MRGRLLRRRLFVGVSAALAAIVVVVAIAAIGEGDEAEQPSVRDPLLTLVSPPSGHVLEPGALKYGFESGRVLKVGTTYHLFISEMAGDPFWRRMNLAHWSSPDAVAWTRVGSLFESQGVNPQDPRDAVWSPIPVYDHDARRWNLFYVTVGTEGRIWRAVSAVPGPRGIGGPFADQGVVLERDASAAPWEGEAGVHSFFPYRVGRRWYALYGSANPEDPPLRQWRVGLATAGTLSGPWRRMSSKGPLTIERRFIENPIVTTMPGGGYLGVYDSELPGTVGVMYSSDGVSWRRGEPVVVLPRSTGRNPDDVRTPLGVVFEPDGTGTLLFTGQVTDPTGVPRYPVFRSTVAPCRVRCRVPVAVEGAGLNQFTLIGEGWARGMVAQSAAAGNAMTIEFHGRRISLLGRTGPDGGIAEVRVDAGEAATVDLYAAAPSDGVIWTSAAMSPGRHTVSLRVTGRKRQDSAGANVAVSGAEIYGPDATAEQ